MGQDVGDSRRLSCTVGSRRPNANQRQGDLSCTRRKRTTRGEEGEVPVYRKESIRKKSRLQRWHLVKSRHSRKRRAPPGEHASDRYDPAQQLDVDGDGLWQRCASALPQRALLLLHLTLQLLGSGKCRIERLFLTWEEEKIRCSKPKTSSLLGAYEAWVGSHSGLARNVETTLYVAPQLVPRRVMAESGHAVRLLAGGSAALVP
ncbi:hypothetical protein PF010_g16573 [Phytophthora fragariae]|uniref:Uncharacterized protein n=1 Tax=Phytophthora fragariae TaxID=53985 RepID=A0A6G0KQX3_9STRA|nr:hypothetical protein PF010_g16573 [Phytophthora fragariae]